ncbi:MAG TPA: membrane protein insertase YidC [Actinophytocola sp.]|uniref:YidC/Oxa1 family membrane protein insertase n=1 Tax=Actinophytocola sp. TaxID=1872138 RepID=UPI002DDD68D0|nr:membrane protein insertase YidC [Actinophytocola sp.]HEV2779419.1 membrane protein insertase YidC [Actinophytocola sp.]
MFTLLDVPVAGAHHLVLALAGVLDPAIVIVLITIAVRLALHPLARAAARGERARTALAPQVRELQRKYGKDRERFARELAALHRSAGTSMFAGCLPMLAQLPFFVVLFRLFSAPTIAGAPNALLDRALLGTPLGAHWPAMPADPVFLGLFAALAAVAWCSARIIRRTAGDRVPLAGLLRLLPYGSLIGAALIPLAAGLYLLTTTAWGTAERAYLRRVPTG